MNEPILTLNILPDEDMENPFDWIDQCGEIAHWHPHHRFGSKNEIKLPRDKESIQDWLSTQDQDLVIPLYLYEHSGMTIRTGPFGDPWDSGQVGFIFTTRDRYLSMVEDPPRRYWKAHARKLMQSEVETLDQWLTGDCWGYVIEDQDGSHIDSCWGFYGRKHVEQEANSQLAYFTKKLCTPSLPGLETT